MLNIGIVTVSDRSFSGEREDLSGPAMRECLQPFAGHFEARTVPDDQAKIAAVLRELADDCGCDFIFTSGGTGFAPRDVTPEATREVIEKDVPGIPEAIRAESLKITPRAMLSRAVAGIRGKTLIVNLPGSPKAVRESLAVVLPILEHAAETMSGKTLNCGKA